ADESGGGIGAATADSTAHGQALEQLDIGAQRRAACRLQLSSGTDDQVAVVVDARQLGVQAYLSVAARGEGQFVAMIEKLKQRLQLVITVGATAEDVQHEVELGWSGQRQALHHCPSWRGCQSLMTRVICRSRPLSLIRAGRAKPFSSV